MKRLSQMSLMMVIWMVPAAAMAQGAPADRAEERGFVAPLSTIGSGDHSASTTETSPARARTVRRGGRTMMLSNGSAPSTQRAILPTRMADAGR